MLDRKAWRVAVGAVAFTVLLFPWHAATAQGTASPTQPGDQPGLGRYVGGIADRLEREKAAAEQPAAEAETVPAEEVPEEPGSAVQARKGKRAVTTIQSTQTFDPILQQEVEYPELPEGGDPIDYSGMHPVSDFLALIAESSKWNVIAAPSLNEMQVQFWVQGVTPGRAMEMLQFSGIYYTFEPATKTLFVMPVEEHLQRQFGGLQQQEFRVQHADVADMEQVLTSLLSKNGRLISDPRTGSILVWDTSANLQEMQDAVRRLDLPLDPMVLSLKYVQAEDVVDRVETMLSERGMVQADPRANTLVVTDLPARQEEIMTVVRALDRRLDTHTWDLDYIDVETASERLEEIIPEETASITIDEDRHQISVTATPERLEEVDGLLKSWDLQPQQVQIEAFLVTMDATVARNFGIDWAYFDDAGEKAIAIFSGEGTSSAGRAPEEGQRFSLGRLPYQVPLRNPVTREAVRDIGGRLVPAPEFRGDNLVAVLDYLHQTGEVRILQRPRVTVQDGQEAIFKNTRDVPYQNVGFSQYASGTGDNFGPIVIPLTVEKVTVGTILEVEPRITEEGTIVMNIAAEDSTAENVNVIAGDRVSTIPEKRENSAQTQVLVHDGQTIVIGGLRSDSFQDDETRVPGLGDVPVVGRLFRRTEKRRQERELMIFLTPTVVSGHTQPEAERIPNTDAIVSEKVRNSLKPLLEQLENKLKQGRNEIGVAVGETGQIYAEGHIVTLEQLEAQFGANPDPENVTVVIRAHPRAPQSFVDRIAESASATGIAVERDADALPFVPAPPPPGLPPLESPKTP